MVKNILLYGMLFSTIISAQYIMASDLEHVLSIKWIPEPESSKESIKKQRTLPSLLPIVSNLVTGEQ